MKYASAFAGIGGFDLAFDRLGMENTCQIEWNRHCQTILARQFPGANLKGDIHDVTGADLGDADVVVGGFPCQDTAIAAPHRPRPLRRPHPRRLPRGARRHDHRPRRTLLGDPMRPTLALASIDAVAAPHRGGHRCTNGEWHNDLAGPRTLCPVRQHLDTVRQQVEALHASVHEAAHDDALALAVGTDAIGYYDDWVANDLDDDDRAGILMIGRRAIERLAAELDRDHAIEARAQAVRERLAAAGLSTDSPQ